MTNDLASRWASAPGQDVTRSSPGADALRLTTSTALIGVLLLSHFVTVTHSQEELDSKTEEPTAQAEEATPELQARWEYFVPVPIPAAKTDNSTTLVDLILGRDVFAHARPDLADLRLYDTTGKTIPYSLRYRRPQSIRESVTATEFQILAAA